MCMLVVHVSDLLRLGLGVGIPVNFHLLGVFGQAGLEKLEGFLFGYVMMMRHLLFFRSLFFRVHLKSYYY